MPIADWTVPFTVTAPTGTLLINQQFTVESHTVRNVFNPVECKLGPTLGELITRLERIRATKDNLPQSDGSLLHHRFLPGMVMNLSIEFWDDTTALPACGSVLQAMLDDLMLVFRALQNAQDDQGRISWVPDGQNERMLDDIRLLTYPAEEIVNDTAGLKVVFAVDSPWPYTEDLSQTVTNIVAANTITQTGTAPYFPVFKVYGPGTNFQLMNTSDLDPIGNPKVIVWSGSGIGGGDYIEISTFRNTMFKNGDQADELYGLDFTLSDFWQLLPGDNGVTLSGDFASVDVLWQPAWA
jgi:hypothetical protein